ncbi:MAG: hypothetical protein ACFCU5_18350 [Pleurocapsa sp.]
MKSGEITRLIICLIIGALIIFIGQPWLYESRIIRITDVPDIKNWIGNYYMIQAAIVFGIAVISVIFWSIAGIKAKATGSELKAWRTVWYVLLFINVLSIFLAIYFKKVSDDALLPSALLLLFDVIWIFWLGTALSSPNLFMYLPPGSGKIRRVFGD